MILEDEEQDNKQNKANILSYTMFLVILALV